MTSFILSNAEQLLADQLAQASPDLLRGLLSTFIRPNAWGGLESQHCPPSIGAGYRRLQR